MKVHVNMEHDVDGFITVTCYAEDMQTVFRGKDSARAYRHFTAHIKRHKDPVRYAENQARQAAYRRNPQKVRIIPAQRDSGPGEAPF